MNYRILVFSDSLALPRQTPEFVSHENTWPELLRREGIDIVQCSIGGATSTDLRQQLSYYNSEVLDVNTVIVQCGIVDCAPRFLKKGELKLLRKLPFLGKKLISVLNKDYIRKYRNITYTPKEVFQYNIQFFRRTFENKGLKFIGIVPATEEYEKILPGIKKNIQEYNNILKASGEFIDLCGVQTCGLMSDFHHLNFLGHQIIYERLMNSLQ